MTLCTGTTRAGGRCRAHALRGTERCRAHTHERPDAEAVAQVVAMLRAGNYLAVAARAAGVEVDELTAWPEISEELDGARAEGEARAVARIAASAADNWQAAAWLLERQYPDRWARPAMRQGEEKPAPPIAARADSLDELARRRHDRRAART